MLAVSLAGSSASRASELTFDFSTVFRGSSLGLTVVPGSPVMQAIFQDVSPGVVRLTVSNLNLTANENVPALYFNLNPTLNPADLHFQFESGSGFVGPSVATGDRAYFGPGLHFGFSLHFLGHGDSSRTFGSGEFVTELISGIPTLTADDFGTFITRRTSPDKYYAVAGIDQLGDTSQSTWLTSDVPKVNVPVPEPGSFALLSALIGAWLALCACKRAGEFARLCKLQRIPLRRTPPASRR